MTKYVGKYWCWWMSRFLLKTNCEKVMNGKHFTKFEDFGDCIFWLDDEQVAKLEKK